MSSGRDLWVAGGLALFALVVYGVTAAPGITFEDSGEFVTAALLPGVAHPSGYPTWTVLAHLFSWLPLGEPAFRVNLFSGAASAAMAGVFYLYARRLSVGWGPALGGALAAGFGLTLWSQSGVAEVYTLNALAMALLLLACEWFCERPDARRMAVFGLLYGLAAGNHFIVLLYSPVFALYLILRRRVVLSPPFVGAAVVGALIGLSIYLYLPLRSMGDPALDWGNPETWDNFWVFVQRKQFASADVSEGVTWGERWGHFLVFCENLAWREFTPVVLPLALLGVWHLGRERRDLALLTGAMFLLGSVGLLLRLAFHDNPSRVFTFRVYYINSYALLGLWAGFGLHAAARLLGARFARVPGQVALAAVGAVPLVANWTASDLSEDRLARMHASAILATVEEGGALIDFADDVHVFPLTYARMIEGERPDVLLLDHFGLIFNSVDGESLLTEVMTTTSQLGAWKERAQAAARAGGRPVYYLGRPQGEDLDLEPVGILFRELRPGEEPPTVDFEERYGEILALTPEDVPNYMARAVPVLYHLRHGQALARAGEEEAAGAAFDRAEAFAAGHVEGLALLALDHNRTGRFDRGERCYQELLALVAPSERPAIELDKRYSRIEFLTAQGDEEAVDAQLRGILDRAPDYEPARESLANRLYKRGTDRARVGSFAEAIALLREAQEWGFDRVRSSCQIAICLFETGERRAALESLEDLARRAPENTMVLQNLAVLVGRLGDRGREREVLEKLLAVEPEHAYAQGRLRALRSGG